jgi:hypothetical protein
VRARHRRLRRCARRRADTTLPARTTHSFWNTESFKPTRDAAEAAYAAAKAAHDELIGRPKRKAVDGAGGAAPKKVKLSLTGAAVTLIDIDGVDWVRDANGHVRRLTGPVYASVDAAAAAADKAKANKKANTAAVAAMQASGSGEASGSGAAEEEESGADAAEEEASGAASQ